MSRAVKTAAAIAMLALSGCMTTAPSFVPAVGIAVKKQPGTVAAVSVAQDPATLSRGDIRLPMGADYVAGLWREGVVGGLRESQLFTGDGRAFEIRVTILSFTPPNMAFDASTPAKARYQVIDAATRDVEFSTEIETESRVAMGESLVGGERIQLSINRAVQSNIALFIERLSAASLQAGAKATPQ